MKSINLAIIGQTGVGKSSLINYLFDKPELAETGSGKPVTKPGFHKYNKSINGKKITIYDSFGIEPGKTMQWLQDFERFIGPLQNSKDIYDWLHSCIFCFSGASARIQDFEMKVLKRLKEKKINPVVVVTNADSSSANELSKKIYEETGDHVIQVTSVFKEKFVGSTEPSGKEKLIDQIERNSLDGLKNRVRFMMRAIEKETLRNSYIENFNHVKEYLNMEGNIFEDLKEKKFDFILKSYQTLQNKDFETLKLKLKLITRQASELHSREFEMFESTKNKSVYFDPSEYDEDEDLNLLEGFLVFSIGLPLIIGYGIRSIFGNYTNKKSILSGIRSKILDSVKKDPELYEFLEQELTTSLE